MILYQNFHDSAMIFPDIPIPDDIQVVSFDIFDTLLVRPYIRPKDLFKHAEIIADEPGFSSERIDAENRAREKNNKTEGTREVTIDDIYSEIRPDLKSLKKLEMELEKNCIMYAPAVELFNKLHDKGKRMILTSDMYLPSSFLDELLRNKGVTGYSRIYVSCEHSASKRAGTLFTKVLGDLEISAETMMHIGDNKHSDGKVPMNLGIRSFVIPTLSKAYFNCHRSERRYYRKDPSLYRSIITAVDAVYWMNCGFKKIRDWKHISYRFGGPLVYDYCRFIHINSQGKPILFVARDGYNLQKVYVRMYGRLQQNAYIYAPRIANLLAGDDYNIYSEYKQTLVSKLFPSESTDMSDEQKIEFFDENPDRVIERRQIIKSGLRNRFKKAIDNTDDEIVLVDVTTLKYSSQRLVSQILDDKKIHGLYYFILDDRSCLAHTGYTTRSKLFKIGENVNITEFFMTSPEPPIEMISDSGEPVFKPVSSDEKMRLDIYDQVTEGELEYAEEMKKIFGDNLPAFGRESIAAWINTLVYHSDAETKKMLTDMKWPVDANHERYVSMIFHPRDTLYHLKKNILDLGWFVFTKIR